MLDDVVTVNVKAYCKYATGISGPKEHDFSTWQSHDPMLEVRFDGDDNDVGTLALAAFVFALI